MLATSLIHNPVLFTLEEMLAGSLKKTHSMSVFHFKLVFWASVVCLVLFVAHRRREVIKYKFKEIVTKLKLKFGGYIRLNESFTDDLEAGLSSRNFDIISQNSSDPRSGLDEVSKEEIRRIMEEKGISFDKARLFYTTQKFGENNVAPDGTPMDPKAVTFSRN